MPRGPRNLRVSLDGEGLTLFGGVALLQRFFRRIALRGQLSRAVRFVQRNNRYTVSESIEALLYPLILGLGRIETTEPLRRNGVFQYLAGLPGYPEASSLRRFLQRLARQGRGSLVRLHDEWRSRMVPHRRVILDLDTTVLTVFGRQEKSAVGYNPKRRGRPSYLPLFCFEGGTRDVWQGSYHPGNTNPSAIVRPFLAHAFVKLPPSVREVRVRADGAFYDRETLSFIEAQRAFYVIVVHMNRALKSRLGGLRYRKISSGIWAADFQYQPHAWPHLRRVVVIRRPVPEEPSAQLHLFQMGGYTYQAFVTNLKLKPLNLWRFYNQRATAELIIRELKDAYALGKIPTHDFLANETFFQVALLAYNLLNWFKRLCAPPSLERATLQRLRQRLFVTPAQLVRPAGVPTLRIPPSHAYANEFLQALHKIDKLKSPFGTK